MLCSTRWGSHTTARSLVSGSPPGGSWLEAQAGLGLASGREHTNDTGSLSEEPLALIPPRLDEHNQPRHWQKGRELIRKKRNSCQWPPEKSFTDEQLAVLLEPVDNL